MLPSKHAIQVLKVLSQNLINPQPQLVSTASIASQLEMAPEKLRRVLRTMEGKGIIQSDPDLTYHLITLEGIRWLRDRDTSSSN